MTTTTKLGLTLVESTDHLVGTSIADGLMFKVNDAFETIDDQIGAVVCTAATRPSSPYGGQPIYETDTRNLLIRNAANSAWVLVNTGIPVVTNTAAVSSPFTSMIVYDTSSAGLKYYTGSVWQIYHPNCRFLYKPTTESVTSSTTLQDDDVFLFSLIANSAYALEGYVVYDGAADPNGGLRSTFSGPAGSSMFYTNFGTNSNSSLTVYNVVTQALAGTRDMGTNAATAMSFQPSGVVVVGGTAGVLQFRWCQGAVNATATRILGGSWMKLTKIA